MDQVIPQTTQQTTDNLNQPIPPKPSKKDREYRRKYGTANPLVDPKVPEVEVEEKPLPVVPDEEKIEGQSSSTETPKPPQSPESALGPDSKPTDPTPLGAPQPTEENPPVSSHELREKERAKNVVNRVVEELRPLVRNRTFVEYVVKDLCEKTPEIWTHPIRWKKPGGLDHLMARLSDDGFLRSLVPSLWVMMGDNIKNIKWAAMVSVGITFGLVCIEFPLVLRATGADKE